MSRTLINTQTSSWPGAAVVGGSRASCVVCARWCPTLPHPGGCSTIGAVRLSFRVRDGGRAFPCRCDHRDDCTGSAWAVLIVVTVIRLSGCLGCPLTTRCVCVLVCGWVGCGPYSGRLALTAGVHPCLHSLTSCVGVEGCCCLCWPISTSQLCQPLPVFHSWPINPVVCWGPTKSTEVPLWRPYLEDGFPLRCFQRLPFPNVANQPCPGRDNWHTRGSSVPVLSY